MGPEMGIRDSPKVAQVGERAPRVSTPTAASVGGDLAKIDTRQPPSSMPDVDLKDVLGKQPVVLNFATPALCETPGCGPVVDVAEKGKAEVMREGRDLALLAIGAAVHPAMAAADRLARGRDREEVLVDEVTRTVKSALHDDLGLLYPAIEREYALIGTGAGPPRHA